MDFKELGNQWREQGVPREIDQSFLGKIEQFDNQLQTENTKLTYWLAGTIYITGIIVLPFLESPRSMLIIGGIWILIGIQSLLFWLRQSRIKNTITHNPLAYIDAKLSGLNYNLMVTNLFLPLYMCILSILSSFYLISVLESVDPFFLFGSIALSWLFYIITFIVFWKKQRKKDTAQIIPMIRHLKSLKTEYDI